MTSYNHHPGRSPATSDPSPVAAPTAPRSASPAPTGGGASPTAAARGEDQPEREAGSPRCRCLVSPKRCLPGLREWMSGAFLSSRRLREGQGPRSGLGTVAGGVGGPAGSSVDRLRSCGPFGVVWPPHVCTKEPARLNRSATGAKTTADSPLFEPVWGPRTLRNAPAIATAATVYLWALCFWSWLVADVARGIQAGRHPRERRSGEP